MLRVTLKGLLAHKLRMSLTALAVVLGIGFIAGTYVLTDTMNATFNDLFEETTSGVDVFVRSESAFSGPEGEDRAPIPAEVLADVIEVPGVASAEGNVVGYAQFVDKEGEAVAPVGPPTLGISWSNNPNSPLVLRQGEPPQGPSDVVMDAATAEKHDFQVGDEVTVLLTGPPREFTITGIAGFGEADNLAGATLAAFEIETAQDVLDKEGRFDTVEIVADEDVTASSLARGVDAVLDGDLEAVTAATVADEQAETLQEGLGFFNTALLVFAGVALFVGAFIIFNTFSIVVAQRTRELALLRALGATGRQVMGSVLIEAFVVGLVASIIGLGFGVLIALGLQKLLSAFGIVLPSTTLQLLPRTIIVALVVGTLTTIVASIFPARRAARIAPIEALRVAVLDTGAPSRRRVIGGGLVAAAGVTALGLGLFADVAQPIQLVGLGAFGVLLGVAILSPLFATPLARVLGAVPAKIFGLPGKLARENAARNPRRTAATAAALMIGLALAGFTAIFGSSVKASVDRIFEDTFRADFSVFSTTFGPPVSFSPSVAERVREVDGVDVASPTRFAFWRFEGATKDIVVLDPATYTDVVSLGEGEEALADLGTNEVMIQRDVAADIGVGPGDTIEMEFASSGKQDIEVHGLFETPDATGDFVISLATYDLHFNQKLDDAVFVGLDEGADADAVRTDIEAILEDYPNLELQDQTEFKETQAAQIDQLLGLITALLALALFIAVLGITNTLALSVFERTHEIGLLRAVGMTRRQTRRMVRWESVIIAVIGGLMGMAVGIFFGWSFVQALADEGIREFDLPGGQLIGYVVAAGLAGVLAAIPPARRAARLNVLEAIATE